VYSPIIKHGDVDILVSFELLETMRYLDMLRPDPLVLVNNQRILPPSVTMGKDRYPDAIPELLAGRFPRFELVDALDAARAAGSAKAANIAFCGALSRCFTVEDRLWKEVIAAMLPPKLVDMNLKAFDFGRRPAS
jgi:indolepyruvate ferredoxin oxidoreductase beta subunit